MVGGGRWGGRQPGAHCCRRRTKGRALGRGVTSPPSPRAAGEPCRCIGQTTQRRRVHHGPRQPLATLSSSSQATTLCESMEATLPPPHAGSAPVASASAAAPPPLLRKARGVAGGDMPLTAATPPSHDALRLHCSAASPAASNPSTEKRGWATPVPARHVPVESTQCHRRRRCRRCRHG